MQFPSVGNHMQRFFRFSGLSVRMTQRGLSFRGEAGESAVPMWCHSERSSEVACAAHPRQLLSTRLLSPARKWEQAVAYSELGKRKIGWYTALQEETAAPGEHPLKAKEKLLRAAVKVFSDKGFTGASTREIARRARVNPVTLFRTFNSKEQLHAAAVDYLISGLQIRTQIDDLAQRRDPAPQFIAGVIKILNDANLSTPEVQRLLLNAALERSELAFTTVWERLVPILQRIQAHLAEYIARGELRDVDPLVAARLIVGAAIYHYQLYELYGAKRVPEFSQFDLSKSFADIVYLGLKL